MSDASQHSGAQEVAFDAEPIIIWVDGNPGASAVTNYLSDTYYGNIETYISEVNLTEVYYNCAERSNQGYGVKKTRELQQMGVQPISTSQVWERAGEFKDEYTPNFPIADTFALATADIQDVPLLAGDDNHWDEPEDDDHDIIRIP